MSYCYSRPSPRGCAAPIPLINIRFATDPALVPLLQTCFANIHTKYMHIINSCLMYV